MGSIFESPDGGHTIYQRMSGKQTRRLVSENPRPGIARRRLLWSDILIHAESDAELAYLIEQVEIYHALRYTSPHHE